MSEVRPIRILVADGHTLVRQGLKALITSEPDMEVVGEAADGLEAVQKAQLLQPDVVLLDLVLPHKDGLEVITEIKQTHPTMQILVLTSLMEDRQAIAAVKAGALGYLFKEVASQELLEAIRNTYQGRFSLRPAVARKLVREFNWPLNLLPDDPLLTEREVEVLELVGQGLTNQTIADRLAISERTVQSHLSNILHKLNLPNRTQAALYAYHKGLVSLDR